MSYLNRLERINERLRQLGVVERRSDEISFVIYPSRPMDAAGKVRYETAAAAVARLEQAIDVSDQHWEALRLRFRAATAAEVEAQRLAVNDN